MVCPKCKQQDDIIERCVQLCLLERDKADKQEPDPPGSTINEDFISGQGWMANLIAKQLRAMKEKIIKCKQNTKGGTT